MNKALKISSLLNKIVFTNVFGKVPMAPPDPVIGITQSYNADDDIKKVNLGVGAYRDDNAKPLVFKIVKKVEKQIVADLSLNKEYAPIDGIAQFNVACQNLIFGQGSSLLKDKRVVTAQSISGTGSLRLGCELIKQQLPSTILFPNPTWANHGNIFTRAGLTSKAYPYYDPATKKVNISKMVDFLNTAEKGNIVLLHACAHNPTGVDPTTEDWKKIAEVMKTKELIPYFDSAYQGFASGDLVKDIQPVRYFADQGFSMFLSQSFAKNMGLYGERVGALHIVTPDNETASKVLSQLKNIIRGGYSSPPIHGARIAQKVLSDQANFDAWSLQLKEIAERVIKMRNQMKAKLDDLKTPGNWDHIVEQIGMFSYTGLTEGQVKRMTEKSHIHMMKNGRMAMVGLNSKNVDYVAEAIHDAVTNAK